MMLVGRSLGEQLLAGQRTACSADPHYPSLVQLVGCP